MNVLFGGWLVIAPWVLEGAGTLAAWASVAVRIALIVLCLPRGPRSSEHYDGWDYYIV